MGQSASRMNWGMLLPWALSHRQQLAASIIHVFHRKITREGKSWFTVNIFTIRTNFRHLILLRCSQVRIWTNENKHLCSKSRSVVTRGIQLDEYCTVALQRDEKNRITKKNLRNPCPFSLIYISVNGSILVDSLLNRKYICMTKYWTV